MKDNALFILVRKHLLAELPERGYPGVRVLQSFQPRQQGRALETTAYLTKVSEIRHGSPAVDEYYDPATHEHTHAERQVMETTFQITVLASERDPGDDSEYTAADVAKAAAAIMQGSRFINALYQEGRVQVLRVRDIKNTPASNDRDRFEFQPSFDIVLTHTDEFRRAIPAISRFDYRIRAV
jgi:hypothetical protein